MQGVEMSMKGVETGSENDDWCRIKNPAANPKIT